MTDRINLTQLRAKAATGDNLHRRDTVLALIDAVEAAHRVATAHHNLRNLGDTISPNVMDALRQALNRFDRT